MWEWMKTKLGATFPTETNKPAIDFFNSRMLCFCVKSIWLTQVKVFFMATNVNHLFIKSQKEVIFWQENIMDIHEFTLLSKFNNHCYESEDSGQHQTALHTPTVALCHTW